MTPYNSTEFTPAAPVAVVELRDPDNPVQGFRAEMLIDTGADITLVPRNIVAAMNLSVDRSKGYELVGFNAAISIEHPVTLELRILGRSFNGQFLCTDERYGILGRNILNHLRLLLDGPRRSWEEASVR